ncbi:MAG TPA: 50S ribosomal protein L23 [Patescibacteria group bacterium]|nr:50S ribosomal protein L23 [Patescibacteria group bacterium]
MKEILISPIVTEKSLLKTKENRYTFRVGLKATKREIAGQVKALYKVTVVKVNVIRNKDEEILVRGRFPGRKRGQKKAIVTLKKGEKIAGFEEK